MQRSMESQVLADLARKMVVLTGARQVGKTTLARALMPRFADAQYLNWDVPADRAVLQRRSWNPRARLLVFDEVHKMPDWKVWLKGVVDARADGQVRISANVTGDFGNVTDLGSGAGLRGEDCRFGVGLPGSGAS